ncbi:SgcJ/EcaC family oxidoreductase [Hymenobacter properus]|uniref:SgcJ/EcaC family oxidoreductase n=1 Tax=Hymenobacter properus TaxID=2791026 RepID=A0A931BJX1_9BACT|nr:SgcJ/EcaC family oxidoreductase [Hymenobacter properus]MBF9143901.1 SgcJ/EcaC family oxidoreductase [Hymenobacter properus]MBR7722715.1 SgcJ/EcaC family oxidoreductase [Microvirga sp. SRT04]
MKTLVISALGLALVGAAHGQAVRPTSPDEQAVRQVLAGTVEAWNQHDTGRYFSYFAPEAQWVNVVGMWWHNVAEHRYALDIFMQVMFNKTTHTVLREEVKMLRPDLALVRHHWKLDGWVMPDGRDMSAVSTGVMTMLMEKRNNKWLVIDGQNTSIDKQAVDPVLTMKK